MQIIKDMITELRKLEDDPAAFAQLDRELGIEQETPAVQEATAALGAVLDRLLGPVYDTLPRVPAMQATFTLGVLVGKRLDQRTSQ